MKYRAPKPLYLTESDWALKVKNPKDYSFSPNMVKKQTALDLPDNEFIHGLAKEGLIVAAREGSKKVRPAPVKEPVKKDPENAMCLENMMNWMMGSIYGLQRTMLPNKKLLPAMRRSLAALGYSKGERQVLLKECAKITSMLIMIDSQDALDDE